MTAWILIANLSMMAGDTITVSGIASLEECQRLGEVAMRPSGIRDGYKPRYQCIEYKTAIR